MSKYQVTVYFYNGKRDERNVFENETQLKGFTTTLDKCMFYGFVKSYQVRELTK